MSTTHATGPRDHTPDEAGDPALRLVCKEIWGGNRDIDTAIALPGLRGHLYSDPADGGRGGDVCFLTTCGSGLFSRIFVADVCGHGQAVSTMSALVNDILRRYMHWPDQRAILKRLNRRLTSIGFDAMTTAAVVSYYPPRHWLSVSYAGHCPAWLYRRQTGTWTQLELEDVEDASESRANIPLAIEAEASFTRRSERMDPGDRLVVLSDGVVEAPDPSGEWFGTARFAQELAACADLGAHALCGRLLERLRTYTGREVFTHDDVTLLVVECVPGPRGSTLRHAIMNRILRPRGNSLDPRFAG